MGRPSKGDRKPVSLRLAPDLLGRVDAAAKAVGLDRQAWIEEAIGNRLAPAARPAAAEIPELPNESLNGQANFVPGEPTRPAKPARFAGFDARTGERIYR